MRTARRLAALAVGLLAVVASGCTGGPSPDPLEDLQRPSTSAPGTAAPSTSSPSAAQTPGSEPSASDDKPSGRVLPIQHYMLVGREYDTVMNAIAVVAQQCMQDQGFDVVVPPPLAAKGALVDISYRRYGSPESLEDAREIGYGIPARAQSDSEELANLDAWEQSLTDAEREALVGPAQSVAVQGRRNGCFGEADRELMGDSSALEASGLAQPPLVLDVNMDPRSTDSEASRKALQKFDECMATAGYPDVVQPDGDRPERFRSSDPQQPSEAEREAAVTQFGCVEKSQVRTKMHEAEVAFQTAAIEANPEAFAQIRQELDDVVRRATEVVAEGGP